jgi:hypothetical protein
MTYFILGLCIGGILGIFAGVLLMIGITLQHEYENREALTKKR